MRSRISENEKVSARIIKRINNVTKYDEKCFQYSRKDNQIVEVNKYWVGTLGVGYYSRILVDHEKDRDPDHLSCIVHIFVYTY